MGATMAKQPLSEAMALCVDSVPVEPNGEYRIAGVYGFGRGLFQRGPIAGSETSYATLNRLHAGDLVMSRLKAFEGAIAVVDSEHDGWFLSPEFPTFRPRAGRLDPMYLGLLCRWPDFWELLRSLSRGIGSRRERVHPDDLLRLEIDLPPIDAQRRVAKRLGATTDASSVIGDLTLRAEKLSDALVVSLATRPDLSEDAKRRGGWRAVSFGDIAVLDKDEVAVEPGASYDIAGVYSFGRGLLRRGPIEGSQTSYRILHRLHAGQVVMSRLKAWEGAIAVVPESFTGSFVSPEFPTFKVDQASVRSTFLEAVLTSEAFWGGLKGASHGIGARRERVGADRLLAQLLWLPPTSYQDQVLKRIAVLDACRIQRQRSAAMAAALGPASLNQAFEALR